jgi:hypothetical protein
VEWDLKKLTIRSKAIGEVTAELYAESSPKTVEAIGAALPITARANTWGDEIYFSIGVTVKPEHAQDVVERGALAYWPPGKAFCIFFGPTPASRGAESRAASPVTVFGRVVGDPAVFKRVKPGDEIIIEHAE